MSEPFWIKPSDLAHHWGCSAANVSNLVKRHGMPRFTSLAEADAWRAVHAPARKRPESSPKNGVEGGEKTRGVLPPTTGTTANRNTATSAGPAFGGKQSAADGAGAPERIDVAQFIDRNADFDALMIEHAEQAPQIAFGLLKRKMADGEPGAISAATKNWHEAAKAAADVREKFVALQRETRALIHIDDVESVVGQDLQEIRTQLVRLGVKIGPTANPANPELATRVIDAAVDRITARFAGVRERVRAELAPPDPAAEFGTPEPVAAAPAADELGATPAVEPAVAPAAAAP
jgi:hypothetical protein